VVGGGGRHVGSGEALSRHQVRVLRKCMEAQPLIVLMKLLGRSDRTKFRHQVLSQLLAAGLLEPTIPDKPTSSRQRYRLTPAGRSYLAEVDG
jgi:ATP-dependent DNA helicase RecG